MGPEHPLPLPDEFADIESYLKSLLEFGTSSKLFQTLCGGVHILDFFTRTPDLYSAILPWEWREWFTGRDMMDVLDLLMRENLSIFRYSKNLDPPSDVQMWRGGPLPPKDLVAYIKDVRRHCLNQAFTATNSQPQSPSSVKNGKIARHIAVGMKVKKVHEVENFAQYVDKLTTDIAVARKREITHLVDFGSGQNYLGRAMAAEPYNKHIVAIESRPHVIEGARNMDVLAGIAPKPKIMRNKKEYRAQVDAAKELNQFNGVQEPERLALISPTNDTNGQYSNASNIVRATLQLSSRGKGSIQYIEHRIKDGKLGSVINQIVDDETLEQETARLSLRPNESERISPVVETSLPISNHPARSDPSIMVISLHSCGNLLHHGLRTLTLNPHVAAVALIGCCYNLLTERLGPPTYKLPTLRPPHPRLTATSSTFDPHGFPMSERLATYQHPHGPGVRLNITARMMAVQAPQNWGRDDSEAFFTRHFFRALLQRIFLDRGVVRAPTEGEEDVVGGVSPVGSTGGTQPIIIGSLRKACYVDFVAYVRGAVAKLVADADRERARFVTERMEGITDEGIRAYEERYRERRKELSVVWSLMAFGAGVVEAMIVVDRWLWLREQEEVGECWVEPVFEYGMSPRNLVVVGIKK